MRERTRSYPIIESRDEPNTPSQEELGYYWQQLKSVQEDVKALRETVAKNQNSDSLTVRGPNGVGVRGRGPYVLGLAFLVVVGVIVWVAPKVLPWLK